MQKRGPKPKRKAIEWSPELAYAVGLIATDGCLSKDGRHITLTSKDLEQLTNFMRCIHKDLKISYKPGGYTHELTPFVQFSDVTLYNFLISIGLTPNKSLTMGALTIPNEYFFDFLRGSYDGDGSFYSYYDARWKSSFMFYLTFTSASESHIIWLRDSLKSLCEVNGHVTRSKKNNWVYNLKYAKQETLIILAGMYQSSSAISLNRKRLKIMQAMAIVGKSL